MKGEALHERRKIHRLLLVEDDDLIAHLVLERCRQEIASAEGRPRPTDSGWQFDRATSCEAALDQARTSSPDLILIDDKLPDGCGLAMVTRLRLIAPAARIIGFSALESERAVLRASQTGFDGFVLKTPRGLSELAQAIHAVLRGRRYFSPEFVARRQHTLRRPDFHGHYLSAREAEVLELVAQGMTDAEVAAGLGISRATAHKHRQSLLTKLDVRCSTKLVARAHALGYGNRLPFS